MADAKKPDPMPLQGEGDYIGARRFDEEQAAFAKSGKVELAARAAQKALDGPEAEELERARKSAAAGKTGER